VPPRTSAEQLAPVKRAGNSVTAVTLGALALATAGVWITTRGAGVDPLETPPAVRTAAAQPAGARPQRRAQDPPRPAQPRRDPPREQAAGARGATPKPPLADPETAAAPAPLRTGKLRVLTVPTTAEIYVEDERVGVGSAFDVEIPAGERHLRIAAPGYVTFDTTITVRADGTVNLATRTLPPASGP
jgi:hypothetical protein